MIKTRETSNIKIWSPFSQQHAYSACYLAKRATEFEKKLNTQPTALEFCELQAFAIACIFAAHAFLEPTINDIFIEADRRGDLTHEILKSLKKDVKASMARIYRFGIQLDNDDGVELDGSGCKTRGVISPSNRKDELRKLTRRLRGELEKQKFKRRLTIRTGVHPLEDLLQAECINWIVGVSFTFVDEFSQKTGIKLYDSVRKLASKRNVAGCGLCCKSAALQLKYSVLVATNAITLSPYFSSTAILIDASPYWHEQRTGRS